MSLDCLDAERVKTIRRMEKIPVLPNARPSILEKIHRINLGQLNQTKN